MESAGQFLKRQALRFLPDRLLMPLKLRHYEAALRAFDETQEPDLAVVRYLVRPGSTAVDVGANIGVYTMVLSSLVGPKGTVIGVEPIPTTFRILSRNCRVLGLANVRLFNAAVSDTARDVTMEVPDYARGGRNFYQAQIIATGASPSGNRPHRFHVRARTLDEIVSGVSNISFVKCDVEGHELQCLRGAMKLLGRLQPSWLVEVAGDPDHPSSAATGVFAAFEAHGYSPWHFDGRRLTARRRGVQAVNYFFLTNDHIAGIERDAPELMEH